MSAPALRTDEIDIVHPRTYVEHGYPHDVWTELRRESPVHWIERDAGDSFWAITKHADIMHVGKNPELFISSPTLFVEFEDPKEDVERFDAPPTLIALDPPKHHKYRQIISKRFTPRAMKKMHPDIERIAKKIVDELLDSGDGDTVDFVEKVAAPLPIAVIAWLLGVPESDWNLIFEWTNRTIGAGDPEYQKEGEDAAQTANAAMIELFTYFTKLVEERRKKPAEDLVTVFANAEVDGKKLEPMDVLAWCFIIVVAGNETTRNGTSGGVLAFAEHPDQLHLVQKDPTLLRPAIEEVLRWTSPIIHFARTATRDTEIRGQKILDGQRVGLFYGSANRDEEVFDRPFEFDVTRRPNRHLAFGVGEHFCAGAHLARLEMEMAYKHLLPRIEEMELAGPPERLYSALVGGVKHLPIRYRLRPA
ncbi:MAG: cytochrome P450 [Myxococcales bacterium]|nr:cytochrome P450 [Myxococcales bacterium]